MEDISFRVSKLEDMIKENVKINDFAKLEKKKATKEDLKGMASKEDLQDLKDLSRISNITGFLNNLLKKRIRRNKMTYSSRVWRKLKNNWRVGIWSPQKLMIHYNIMGSIQVQETTLSPILKW